MLRKKSKKTRFIPFIFLVGLICFLFPREDIASQDPRSEHDPLVYQSGVTAQLTPLFAVDAAGNPVYDLKQEEMTLFVDGQPTPIIFFEGYRLDLQDTTQTAKVGAEVLPVKVKIPERINFIILDTLISNMSTMEASRIVTAEIIKQASSGDAFVILESNQISGLQYILGPTKNREELMEGLAGIKKRFEKRLMFNKGMRDMALSYQKPDEAIALLSIAKNSEDFEKRIYQRDLLNFSKQLRQLKSALKSTTLPKTVFLISAQSRTDELDDFKISYLRLLEEAAKSINYGGSLFYLINPLGQAKRGQGSELKFMADAAGGKFISGAGTKDILKQVKNNTSAYYELAFSIQTMEGRKNAIKITCKRQGVSLTTIHYSEQERSYANMNDTERKLFLLNIVNGGSWSRMTIPIKQMVYSSLNSPQEANDPLKHIELSIPIEIQNRKSHLYHVAVDEITKKAEFIFTQKIVTAKEQVAFNKKEGKSNYFILIDSVGSICYYSRVN